MHHVHGRDLAKQEREESGRKEKEEKVTEKISLEKGGNGKMLQTYVLLHHEVTGSLVRVLDLLPL